MKVFIDTNIILDLIIHARRDSVYALKIFKAAEKGKIRIFTSAIAIADCLYILKATYLVKQPELHLSPLFKYLKITPTSHSSIVKALSSNFKDKEDAIQHFTAMEASNIDYLITRDKSGYVSSKIKIINPVDFVNENN